MEEFTPKEPRLDDVRSDMLDQDSAEGEDVAYQTEDNEVLGYGHEFDQDTGFYWP